MTQDYEKLSALVDGEDTHSSENMGGNSAMSNASLVKSIANDPTLNAKWRSYHLTRDLLRNDMSSDVNFELSDRIAEAIKDELPIVAPKSTWRELPVVAAVLPIVKQSSQLAMVACVTALVIFGVQTYNQPEVSDPFTTAPPMLGPQGGLAPVSLQTGGDPQQARMDKLLEQRRQLNALIQDHVRQQKLRSVHSETQSLQAPGQAEATQENNDDAVENSDNLQ